MNLTEYWSKPVEQRSAIQITLEPGDYQAEEWANQQRLVFVKNEHGEFFQYPYIQVEGEPQLYSTLPETPDVPDEPSLFWIGEPVTVV